MKKFEEEFNRYIGSLHAVAVNSGTSALYLAMRSIPCRGQRVIVPSLTFVSTAHAIIEAGATPVFVDVDESTFNICIDDLHDKLTHDTAAIVLLHFGGRPCDVRAVKEMAEGHDLYVVEDCAHACGATYQERKTGAIFDLGCFSFDPVKNLATFSGGAITINDPEIRRDKIDSARWCGIDVRTRSGPKYDVIDLGWNYYMCEASAAMVLAQLPRLDDANRRRKEIARFYDQELGSLDSIITPPYSSDCVYHIYPIRVANHRDKFIQHMASRGIECGIHYARAVHQFSFYARSTAGKTSLPNTERIVNQLVSIPIYPSLSTEQLDSIVAAIREYK